MASASSVSDQSSPPPPQAVNKVPTKAIRPARYPHPVRIVLSVSLPKRRICTCPSVEFAHLIAQSFARDVSIDFEGSPDPQGYPPQATLNTRITPQHGGAAAGKRSIVQRRAAPFILLRGAAQAQALSQLPRHAQSRPIKPILPGLIGQRQSGRQAFQRP
jgi:hypothetical protein